MRRNPLLAVLVVLALLTACTSADPSTGSGPSPELVEGSGTESATSPSTTSASELAAQKKAAGIQDCPASTGEPVAGGLPDVELACLGGGRSVRLAGLRGPMLINVWAQWCGPCRAEAPFLAEVARRPPDNLRIVGIDYGDPRPDYAIEFAQLVKWTYPQLQDQDMTIRGPLQIAGPPQTFFVDRQGKITYRHSGPFASAAEIRALIEQHLRISG
jgi:cytochrome c biogenesis protein CcmG, thiol:disulfide interchange protein DsbE